MKRTRNNDITFLFNLEPSVTKSNINMRLLLTTLLRYYFLAKNDASLKKTFKDNYIQTFALH